MSKSMHVGIMVFFLTSFALQNSMTPLALGQMPEPVYRLAVSFGTRSTFGAPLIPPLLYEGLSVVFTVLIKNTGSQSFQGEALVTIRLYGAQPLVWPLPSQDVDLDAGKSLEISTVLAPPQAGVYRVSARLQADDRQWIGLYNTDQVEIERGVDPDATGDTSIQPRQTFYTMAAIVGGGVAAVVVIAYVVLKMWRRRLKSPAEEGAAPVGPTPPDVRFMRLFSAEDAA